MCQSQSGDRNYLAKRTRTETVVPQTGLDPQEFTTKEWEFEHYYLQPMDGTHQATNTSWAVKYCLEHPRWKLSLQQHKILGLK